ncbi:MULTISPECIES: hypothetical protein [Pseudomonas]|uniref:Uncharacterized protein n=1 Tax=Pseudomonas lutea TaxID=243924 RepID=A0A9X8QLV1_9PSED|nr:MULTISPECIES: hypothetical protein [Pseudomonas]SER40562.1 hypothetical protein SAMN05216409_11966 [Pseudomonas lutea]
MTVSQYKSINLFSYSPLVGVRYSVTTDQQILEDMDQHGTLFCRSTIELARLTKLADPAQRLQFGLRAYDRAPDESSRENVPLVWMLLHYVRDLEEWSHLQPGAALNIVVIDWPQGTGYELRAWLIVADNALQAASIPALYSARRSSNNAYKAIDLPPVTHS